MSNDWIEKNLTSTAAVQVAEFALYVDAQAAVDKLSDEGFPVKTVSIVWNRLRQVEHVTGRRTVATAARDGALTGAWFGLFIGLVLSGFVDSDSGSNFFVIVGTYLLVGAAVGAAYVAFSHYLKRGHRDFSAIGSMEAETYEIVVLADYAEQARQIIGDVRHHERAGAADPDGDESETP